MDTFDNTSISYSSSHFTNMEHNAVLTYCTAHIFIYWTLSHSPQLSSTRCVWPEVRPLLITVFTHTYFVHVVPCYVHRCYKYSCHPHTMSDLSILLRSQPSDQYPNWNLPLMSVTSPFTAAVKEKRTLTLLFSVNSKRSSSASSSPPSDPRKCSSTCFFLFYEWYSVWLSPS